MPSDVVSTLCDMLPDRLASDDRAALARAVDVRIADLWAELFEVPREAWDHELIGWFLRTAYGQGNCDAQREADRGALCREIEAARDEARDGRLEAAGRRMLAAGVEVLPVLRVGRTLFAGEQRVGEAVAAARMRAAASGGSPATA